VVFVFSGKYAKTKRRFRTILGSSVQRLIRELF